MNRHKIIFVDTETTGLDPDRHEIWEIALVPLDGDIVSWHFMLKPTRLRDAEPTALRINRFYSRTSRDPEWDWWEDVASRVAQITDGAFLAGIVPGFDAAFLTRLLARRGLVPSWHHQLIDVEAMIAGKFAVEPPWDTASICLMAGIDPDRYERHTALGDAKLARDLYLAAMRSNEEPDSRFSWDPSKPLTEISSTCACGHPPHPGLVCGWPIPLRDPINGPRLYIDCGCEG